MREQRTQHPEDEQPVPVAPEKPLQSWKEIASYLERDVRTARRWEKAEALPVRRHRQSVRSSVYAYPSELDAWRAARKPGMEKNVAAGPPWRRRLPSLAFALVLLLSLISVGDGVRSGPAKAQAAGGSEMATRRVWSEASVDSASGSVRAAPSPDGRYLTYTDWDTGNLALLELATGHKRPLTRKRSWSESGEFAYSAAVSPDGRWVAYQWFNKNALGELHVIRLDGSGDRLLHAGNEGGPLPKAWSPNGDRILADFSRPDGSSQIALIAVADGSVRVLKTLPWGSLQGMSFSPDGRYIVYDFPPRRESPSRDIFVLSTDASREIPLVEHRADDFVLGWAPGGNHILFASDRMGTLDAWVVPVADGKPQGPPRLVKQDLGRIQPMGFAANGSYYYGLKTGLRDVQVAEIDLQAGNLVVPPAPAADRFVGSNRAPDWSPDGRHLAYISKRDAGPNPAGGRIICIRALETGEVRELSTGLRAMYRLGWFPDGRALWVTEYGRAGGPDLFRIDAQTGKADLLHRNVAEAAVSPDGEMVYYWRFEQSTKQYPIFARNLKTGDEKELYRGQRVGNLALSPDGRDLAAVEMDRGTGSAALILLPVAGGQPRRRISVPPRSSIAWMPEGRHLIFTGPGGFWRTPREGGEAHRLLGVEQLAGMRELLESFSDLRIHADGRRIAFSGGRHRGEVWVMENFLPELRSAR